MLAFSGFKTHFCSLSRRFRLNSPGFSIGECENDAGKKIKKGILLNRSAALIKIGEDDIVVEDCTEVTTHATRRLLVIFGVDF